MKNLKYFVALIFLSLSFTQAHSSTYFDDCHNDEFGGATIPFHGDFRSNEFRPECAPEVLYTWTVDDLATQPELGKDFGFRYSWRTPISTFGYGPNLLRIKLKKTTKFKLVRSEVRDCRTLSEREREEYVIVSPHYLKKYDIYFTDYVICSSKVAHSWSMGTKASYEEALNEYSFVRNNFTEKEFYYDAYIWKGTRKRIIYPQYIKYFIPADVTDHWSWTEESLDYKLETIKNKGETVYYSPDVQPDYLEHIKIHSPKVYFRLTDQQIDRLTKQTP